MVQVLSDIEHAQPFSLRITDCISGSTALACAVCDTARGAIHQNSIPKQERPPSFSLGRSHDLCILRQQRTPFRLLALAPTAAVAVKRIYQHNFDTGRGKSREHQCRWTSGGGRSQDISRFKRSRLFKRYLQRYACEPSSGPEAGRYRDGQTGHYSKDVQCRGPQPERWRWGGDGRGGSSPGRGRPGGRY